MSKPLNSSAGSAVSLKVHERLCEQVIPSENFCGQNTSGRFFRLATTRSGFGNWGSWLLLFGVLGIAILFGNQLIILLAIISVKMLFRQLLLLMIRFFYPLWGLVGATQRLLLALFLSKAIKYLCLQTLQIKLPTDCIDFASVFHPTHQLKQLKKTLSSQILFQLVLLLAVTFIRGGLQARLFNLEDSASIWRS